MVILTARLVMIHVPPAWASNRGVTARSVMTTNETSRMISQCEQFWRCGVT
jgi:hypothetical protein